MLHQNLCESITSPRVGEVVCFYLYIRMETCSIKRKSECLKKVTLISYKSSQSARDFVGCESVEKLVFPPPKIHAIIYLLPEGLRD